MWVPPETKAPVVYHHPTLNSVGYFAAVRLRDGLFLFRRQTGRFNGESFWEFLKVFKEASAVGGRRVLAISDNAQYHRSKLHLNWRLEQTPGFGLDFLPPYSPELNPIERVWKLTRRLCLHDRYFAFLDSVVDAVESRGANSIPWNTPASRTSTSDKRPLVGDQCCCAALDSTALRGSSGVGLTSAPAEAHALPFIQRLANLVEQLRRGEGLGQVIGDGGLGSVAGDVEHARGGDAAAYLLG